MRALVVADSSELGVKLRRIVLRNGLDCLITDIVGLEVSAERASRLSPDIVIVHLPGQTDTGLRTLRRISHTVDAQILVVGPPSDAQLILNCMQEGATEFVDELHVENDLSAAIVRWKSRCAKPKSNASGRVITVLSPSGGCGASTIAVNIAAALAKQHDEVGLIDLRLSTGDLAAFLDLVPQHTLGDLSKSLERMDSTMLEMAFARHPCGIHLIAAPREFTEARAVTSDVVRQTTALARRRFPYVVLDLENTYDDEQVEAIWQSDATLLVVRLDYTSVRNAQRAMNHLQEIGLDLSRVQLVANRYGEKKQLSLAQAKEVLQNDIAFLIPDDPASVNRAVNEGIPVILQRPLARISRSLSKLAAGVNGQHEQR